MTTDLIPGMMRTNEDGSEEMVREYGCSIVVPDDMPEQVIRDTLLYNFERTVEKFPPLAGKTPEIIDRASIAGEGHMWAWYVCDWVPR